MTSAPPVDPGRLDPGRVDPGPPPPLPHGMPSRGDRFFSWTAGLGLVRGEGWLGGVAAGLAARLRIDPLIVRGILVVVGLFGLPVLVVYGLAWALLPDIDGRIPLQEALRGRFLSSQVGSALCIGVGLVAWPVGLWIALGAVPVWAWGLGALLVLIGLAAAAGLVILIVRAALRPAPPTPGALDAELRTASADSAAPAPSDIEPGREPALDEDARGVDAAAAADTASLPAPSVGAGADVKDGTEDRAPDELAAWRAQHAAWKEQDQAWRQQQQDATRAAREQARRERQARATAFAADAAERRRVRRATSPRAPFAYVAVVAGLAVVLGTFAALQQRGELAPAQGLFVAALVLGVGMVLAGAFRRRSGFLAFTTLLVLLGGAAATALPAAQALHLGSWGVSNIGGSGHPASDPFVQPWGDLSIYLDDTGADGSTHVEKRTGATFVSVEPGVEVTLDVTTRTASPTVTGSTLPSEAIADDPGATVLTLPDGRTRYRAVIASDDAPITTRETLVIDQESGYVEVYLLDRSTEGVQE